MTKKFKSTNKQNKTRNNKHINSGGRSDYSLGVRRETSFRLPLNCHTVFPDRYYCSMKTTMQTIVNIGSASTVAREFHTYKINGIGASTGPAAVGPSINGGTFDVNYPTGLYYLLGSTASAGGIAPYGKYRVHSSSLEVTWISATNSATAANQCPVQVVVFPTSDPYAAYSSLSVTQATEEPWSKQRYFPAVTTTEPKKIHHKIDVLQLFGDRYKASLEDPSFTGTAAADPTQLVYWVVLVTNLYPNGNAYLAEGILSVTVVHNVEFYDRNLLQSVGPSSSGFVVV